jgi:hypothetical protein
MSVYLIDIDHHTHTCPANPAPHPYDSQQTIVAITNSGACRTPVAIRCGDTVAIVACGRHEPWHRQCGNCRTITWTRHTTVTFHGYQGPAHRKPDRDPLHRIGVAA